MKIDSDLSVLYQSGLLQPQLDTRLQQEAPRRQSVAPDAVTATRKSSSTSDSTEYERVRSRVEREQDGRVVPEGLNRQARKAVDAYASLETSEERSYASQMLGVDLFA